jgi:putative endonuclease
MMARLLNRVVRTYYVYIMTNRSSTLYIGVTNDLLRRVLEHRTRVAGSFTGRYRIDRLVYFEETNDIHVAILREKELKGWTRAKKMALIINTNPEWVDLSREWFDEQQLDSSSGFQPTQNDITIGP